MGAALSALVAFLFMLSVSCDSGNQTRRKTNDKRNVPETTGSDDQLGEGFDGESTPESSDGDGTGSDGSNDLSYVADHTLYYSNFAKEAFDAYCASCHPQSVPYLTTFESIRNNAENVKASLIDRSMPPDNSLPAEVRIKMVNWILAGTKRAPAAVSFIAPLRPNTAVAGTSVEIKVAISNNSEHANWKLYYNLNPDSSSGNTLISSQPVSGGSAVSWDTSSIAPGTYYLIAELNDGIEKVTAVSTGTVRIGLPSIVLGTGWRQGNKAFLATEDLTYTLQHIDNSKTYSVKLAAKKNAADSYQTFVDNHADAAKFTLPGSYVFTDGLTYTFKATLLENGTEIHTDESDGPVGIATAAVSYADLRSSFIDSECKACHESAASTYLSDLYDGPKGAKAMAAKIEDHMNNASSPMPPDGLLAIEKRDRVKLWFWLGAEP